MKKQLVPGWRPACEGTYQIHEFNWYAGQGLDDFGFGSKYLVHRKQNSGLNIWTCEVTTQFTKWCRLSFLLARP